jgi:trimeric autotransporter adhesin
LFGPTIEFVNGASVNNIKNSVIKGVYNGGGVIEMGPSTAATGNNSNIIQNNDITKGTVSPLMGISNMGSLGLPNTSNTYTGNRIIDFIFYGFSDGNGGAGYSDQTLFNANEIYQTVASNGDVTGIMIDNPAGITNMRITNNKIFSLLTTDVGAEVIGINIYEGISVAVINNFVSISTSGDRDIFGIAQQSNGNDIDIYFNSVQISGTGSGASATAAFLKSYTSVNDDVRNNIFSNIRITSGTGGQYAIAQTDGAMASNYNDLYSNGNANNFVGLNNGTNYATLAAWRTGTGQDLNSVSVAPVFTSATDLHLVAGSNSGLDNKGINIASVPTDIDNQTRSVTPDLGADEMPASSDVNPPTISYTPFGFTCSTADLTLTASIVDATGVPTTGSLVPRIYYKKSTGGTWFSKPGTLTSGTATNGNWSLTISSADLGTLTAGDIVQYYVIAQDVASPANIGSSPSGAVASDVNTVTTHPSSPGSYSISSNLSGTFTVGSGGTYATLTAAINAYNNSCLTGPVVFSLISATYSAGETFPLVINANINAGSTNTLTIKPAAGIVPTISSDTSIFVLNGAKYVTIDGSNTASGTTKDLTLSNTRTTGGPTFWFLSGATNNTLKNTILKGVTTSLGVIQISTAGSALTGNNNNTIQNNDITKGATSPIAGIYNTGTAGRPNTGNIIRNNRIFDFNGYGFIEGYNGNGNTTNTLFESNEIYQTSSQPTALFGIYVQSVNVANLLISRNHIHDLTTSSTGTIAGINIVDAASVTVSNNMIAIANTSSAVRGIMQQASAGATVKVYYNSVSISGTSFSGTSYAFYKNFTSTGDQVKDNIFVNTRTSSSGSGQYAIGNVSTTGGSMVSDYNDLVSTGSSFNFVGRTTSNAATLADWRTLSGLDANSVSVMPVFTSAINLHLVPGSNAGVDNMGTPVAGITVDFDNDTRNATTPDIGADEMASCTQPVLTSPTTASICTGTNPSISLTANMPSTFTWTLGRVTGGITGASAGSGNTINQTLTNPGSVTDTVEYIVTPTSTGGCAGNPTTITVKVYPKPAVTTANTMAICSGSSANISLTANMPSTFNWTIGTVTGGITGASAGSGSVINQTLTNPSNTSAGSVQYLVTPTSTAGSCTGNNYTITVTVNPIPVGANITTAICSGSNASHNLSASTPSTFSWTVTASPGVSGASAGSGASINQTLTYTGGTYGIATYNVTATSVSGACASAIFFVTDTVYAGSNITSEPTDTICSGTAVNYLITSSSAGATFTWSRAAVAGISNPAVSGQTSNPITETLVNTTGSPRVVTYNITATGSGCPAPFTYSVTVNPTPQITSAPAGVICSGVAQNYLITSGTTGTTYIWNRPAVAGISNGSALSTANPITETLINTTTSPVTVTYGINATANGCSAPQFNYQVTVEPKPQASFITSSPACQGSPVNFTNTSAGTGLTYFWNFGDNSTSTTTNPTHTYAAPGIYTVKLVATSFSGCPGDSVIMSITIAPPASITSQPTDQTACTGSSVSFTVSASGPSLTYQWRKNGTPIAGATSATYTIPSVIATDAGNYDVVINSDCGTLTSNTATLTLDAAPAISAHPQSQTACTGSTLYLYVTASGSNLSYVWRKNGIVVPGVNNDTLTLSPVTAADAATYDVVVATSCATSATSNSAVITVATPVSVTTDPGPQSVCTGGNISITAAATGSSPITYQWRKSGVNISGATSATYTITGATPAHAGNYDVVITNACGSVTTTADTLIVNSGPTIATQPVNQTVCTGSSASFQVVATGTGLTYQWRKAGVAITGATSSTYTIPSTTAGDAGSYDVVVTGTCGSVTSNIVTLTTNAAPSITTQPASSTVCTGGNVTLTVVVSGSGLTYQWRKGGVNISGATSSSYTISNANATNAGSYDVVVSSSCATSVTSNTATVTVSNAATINSQPSSQTVCAGSIATFSVTATASGTLSYQWRKNGTPVTGANSASYQIVNTLMSNAGIYDVVVTSSCGSLTSNPAILVVSNCTAVPQLSAEVIHAVLMPSVMKQSTNVKIVMQRSLRTEWVVTDALGNVVKRFAKQLHAGENNFRLETSDLASGTYQLTGTSSGKRVVVLRFIKQ